jgi:Xaa-Pro aminopeptidase
MILERLQKLRAAFGEHEIDALLVSQAENRRYLSGFDGSAGYLLIAPEVARLATDSRYLIQAAAQAPEYRVVTVRGEMKDWLPELVGDLGDLRLGFEAEAVSFSLYRRLSAILKDVKPGLRLVPVTGLVEALRAVKKPAEIDFIIRAAAISDAAFERAASQARPGMTELELAWELERLMREAGSEALPFDIIVAAGPNAAKPHHRPSDRPIAAGEPVVIDIGARIGGYASDLSRTICLGGGDGEFGRIYDTVLAAQLAAIALIEAGMSGEEADRTARVVIEEAGLGEAFGHSLGHGVGLAAHEEPRLGAGSTALLGDGMVFTVEPGVYLAGWGGVRIEDTVTLESGKIRTISKSRKVRD